MAPGFLVLKVYIYSFKQYRMADFGTPSKNKMLRPMIICLLGLVVAHLSTAQRRGETGKTGVPGDDGATGRPGKDGETGGTGATGQFGVPGRTGGTGATGPMGIPGATGYSAQRAGPTGATGEQGPPGQPGLPGPSAVLGRSTRVNQRAKGPQGPPGRVGPTGLPGAQGPPGTPGTIPPVIDCSLYGPRRLQMEEEAESFIKGLVNSYTLATASIALCVVSLEILLGTFVYTSSKSRQLWKRLYLLQTQ